VKPFRRVEGRAVVIDRDDVDTDQIVPAEFLKRVQRDGFGECLFHAWREDAGFPLNRPGASEAVFLVAGRNFGCGSSREHAVWALEDWGFRAIVAPSFADIFRTNCTKVGLLPVQLPEDDVRALKEAIAEDPATTLTIDLAGGTVTAPGLTASFDVDDHTRHRLLEGLDDIALTLAHADAIAAFESARARTLPSLTA
jgi:3-isopropylmalate/(R)-2-methylmalate dehydratase small subunit